MTEKEDDKVGEDFVQAWRIMDEVIGSILRENPNLNPGRKRDQDVIARLLNEKVKNDDTLDQGNGDRHGRPSHPRTEDQALTEKVLPHRPTLAQRSLRWSRSRPGRRYGGPLLLPG
jgi:hypothetical protein